MSDPLLIDLTLGAPGLASPRRLDQASALGLDIVVHTAGSPLGGKPNQDGVGVYVCGRQRVVVAVADGLGGHIGGDRASQTLLDALRESVRSTVEADGALRAAVLDGIEHADARIRALGLGSGTTVVAAIVDGGGMRTVHAGDSAALLCGQRGRLKQLTISHSPVGYGIESGLLDAEDAMSHHRRHLISNAVGVGDLRVELGPILEAAPRDTLVLASDGLWDNLRVAEVVEIVRRGPLLEAGDRLAREATSRMAGQDDELAGKPDDLSFVLLRRVGHQQAKGSSEVS